jgi:hypothetical protein
VHFYPTSAPDTIAASAVGTLFLSTQKPGTPSDLRLGVGETRLRASWKAGSSGATTRDYEVVTTPVNPADPTPGSFTVTGTDATIDGLINFHDYNVVVYARSLSETRSDPSNTVQATPAVVNDFWEVYKDGTGPETGGCGGPAGPLALVAAAIALAAARRRS